MFLILEYIQIVGLHACTVLSVIGNLMREYPDLLFDFRVTEKRDIPEGYSAI